MDMFENGNSNWERLTDIAINLVEQYFPVGLDRAMTVRVLEKAKQLHQEQASKKSGGAVSIK
tara:strand:- start:901 stop:1086 length:186 start_codon:yes stop_codon:yes gene_type:complete